MTKALKGVKALAVLAVLMTVAAVSLAWALPGTGARFSSRCAPSHTNNDDPIVFPRKPGWSHRHQYFGARRTNAFSKPSQLVGGPTTCEKAGDTAAYWVPTLEVDGEAVKPQLAQAYYGDGEKRHDLIVAFPPGLKMIAGRPGAATPQPVERATWYCLSPPGKANGRDGNVVEFSLFALAHERAPVKHPYCDEPGATLSALIRFPDCWDGRRLDSGDHRSHVAYSRRRPRNALTATCAQSHPVPVPQLSLAVHYPTRGHPKAREVELSSGGPYSLHADFINSWDQSELERLVRTCINLSAC